MKEKIYTIPITDAFKQDCECPLCLLEKKLEDEALEYCLGPSMMEPDSRIDSNKKGFCQKHFNMLYNLQKNRLSLSLVIDTHLVEQVSNITKIYEKYNKGILEDVNSSTIDNIKKKFNNKKSATENFSEECLKYLNVLEESCVICSKIENTMERFLDVILYLYFKEDDFKTLFLSKKGFCLKHFKMLINGSEKYLKSTQKSIFINCLVKMQLENMQRIQEEVNYFSKKFDYRYKDAPWNNSKDAVSRSIEKIVGPCRFT